MSKMPFLLMKGMASYIPGISNLTARTKKGTISARYCYSVWLRHLCLLFEHGFTHEQLNTIAELGPGSSLGIGLAALITGAQKYYAFDVVKNAKTDLNLQIFDQLVELFEKQEDIPDQSEFPLVNPHLGAYKFPRHILSETYFKAMLAENRIQSIRNAILNLERERSNERIQYFAPWYAGDLVQEESVDLIFSQAVLEHVNDIQQTYQTFCRWLKTGGFMSHQIDFKCHKTAEEWNGHWQYSDLMWKLITGNRPFLINRQPYSRHIDLLDQSGLKVICEIKATNNEGIDRKNLALPFQNLSDDDLITSGAFMISKKEF